MAPPSTVASIVAQVIAPYVGEHMARAAVRAHFEKLKIETEDPSLGQLATFLQNLQQGLVAFVGRDKSAKIIADVTAALERERAPR